MRIYFVLTQVFNLIGKEVESFASNVDKVFRSVSVTFGITMVCRCYKSIDKVDTLMHFY